MISNTYFGCYSFFWIILKFHSLSNIHKMQMHCILNVHSRPSKLFGTYLCGRYLIRKGISVVTETLGIFLCLGDDAETLQKSLPLSEPDGDGFRECTVEASIVRLNPNNLPDGKLDEVELDKTGRSKPREKVISLVVSKTAVGLEKGIKASETSYVRWDMLSIGMFTLSSASSEAASAASSDVAEL
jgi:hypothetical protein